MPQKLLQANPENASVHELRATMRAGRPETQLRCLTIMMLITGSSREQVCKLTGASERAIRKWIHAFNACGIDGLIVKKRTGAPRKIPPATASQLVGEIEQPEQAGRTFWTATAFHGYITDKYRLECCYDTVRRFFHEKGFALKVPQPWPDRQDEQQRQVFREQLRELVDDPNVDIWYADETGIEGEPKPRRRWAKKGSQPRVIKNGDHIRMNILGMVCPRNGEFFAIEATHSDSDVFQAFLDEAAKYVKPSRRRNVLIVDNASWHKKKTLNWHMYEPLFLPPYSPDFNPIERLWLVMKANWFNNIHCKTYEALVKRADQAILDLIHNPKQVAQTTGANGT